MGSSKTLQGKDQVKEKLKIKSKLGTRTKKRYPLLYEQSFLRNLGEFRGFLCLRFRRFSRFQRNLASAEVFLGKYWI